jgi:hypothetical protein
MNRTLTTAVATALLVGAVASPALAQSPSLGQSPTATIDIDHCHVKTSRNAGGFTWAYCPIVVNAPGTGLVSVHYRSNLATFKPPTNGTWSAQSGTLKFTGGGDQLLNVALAFKKLTPAQVTSRLKVTLSNATGATIGDGSATVGNS